MLVEAKEKGFYGGELRVIGERFNVTSEDEKADWFEPVDKSIIAKRETAKVAKESSNADDDKTGEAEKEALMAEAKALGLSPHPKIGVPKLQEAIAAAKAAKKDEETDKDGNGEQ